MAQRTKPDIKRPDAGGFKLGGFPAFMLSMVVIAGGIIGGAYWYKHRDTGEHKRGFIVQSGLPSDFFAFDDGKKKEEEKKPARMNMPPAIDLTQKTEQPTEQCGELTKQQVDKCIAEVKRKKAAAKKKPKPKLVVKHRHEPTHEELVAARQQALIDAFNAKRRGAAQIRVSQADDSGQGVEWINSTAKWEKEKRDEASYPMRDRDRIITEAVLIPAILREEINSELGGKVVAQVEQNVYGESGRKILIPAGSKAIGRYLPLKKAGDTRINIIWHRIITPEGINIHTADAEMADAMGRAGVTGQVDNHYFERFGIALLVSTLTAVTTYNVPVDNQGQAVVIQSYGQGATSLAQSILNDHINIKPTVTIPAGSRIMISPQRDIWFPKPKKKETSIFSLEDLKK